VGSLVVTRKLSGDAIIRHPLRSSERAIFGAARPVTNGDI